MAVTGDFRALGAWRDRTYLDDFLDVVTAQPDRVAIVSTGADGSVDTMSYLRLGRLVDRFAGALLELGVGRGDVVAVQLPNGWQFAALILATARVGAVVNPLVSILRHRELSFILALTEAKVFVVPATSRGFDHAALARQLGREVPNRLDVYVVGDDFEDHFVERRWEDDPSLLDRLARRRPRPDDVAEIQFTSGTTGEPKGVQHTFNTINASMRAGRAVMGATVDDPIFMASPLGHQTGFLFGVIAPLSSGAKTVYQDVWAPAAALTVIADERVVWSVGATPFVMDLIAAQRQAPRPLPTFRMFACGGAPIPPHLVAGSQEVLGAELIALWGMTENGIVTCTRPGDPLDVVSASDGFCVPWMELRIVDGEGGELPVGQPGRLQVRGANQTPGYYKRPELYEASLTADGWFDTGDMAVRRPDGGIRIAGRYKDLIIRGGENIPVADVEATLYSHPKIKELAVVGYPDERLGERSCAVVVPERSEDPPTLAELAGHCERAGLAKPFWPERVEVWEELPKTPSGKIQKYKVRDALRAD
jgi:cyclohexanecarboxylate-CoA ligase